MKVIHVKNCDKCPYKHNWLNDLSVVEPYKRFCAKKQYKSIPSDCSTFPIWCPLKNLSEINK